MAPTLQRPGPPLRSQSASSFAEGFSLARHQVDKDLKQLAEEGSSDSDVSDAPSLIDAGAASPASLSTPLTGPITPELAPPVADDFAFAFDIDGVLIRGGRPIPEAIEAMKELNGENEYGIRVYVTKFHTEQMRN